eukprot:1159482-Pelagomonas_calceolata.AAC.9
MELKTTKFIDLASQAWAYWRFRQWGLPALHAISSGTVQLLDNYAVLKVFSAAHVATLIQTGHAVCMANHFQEKAARTDFLLGKQAACTSFRLRVFKTPRSN